MKYHYTYYSYEEWGRGYIGKRSCKCKPEEDVKYFGSYRDKTFKPTQKIILATYDTAEEAISDEIKIQRFFEVVENSHFINQVYQTSTGFRSNSETARKANAKLTPEQRSERSRKGRAKLTPEQRSETAKKANASRTLEQRRESTRKAREAYLTKSTPEQRSEVSRKGNAKLTPEQRSERSRKANAKLTPEQRSERSRKGRAKLTPEQRSETAKKAASNLTPEQRSEIAKKASSQMFQCTETGFIANAGGLAMYQKARGIDTSKRIRIN
jgi:hypothetical protein